MPKYEGFEGFKPVVVPHNEVPKESEGTENMMSGINGPLAEKIRSLSPEELGAIDRLLFNPHNLNAKHFQYVPDSDAEAVFDQIRDLIKMEPGDDRKNEAKKIADYFQRL